MREVTDILGNTEAIDCIGCAILSGKIENPGGSIASTEHFDVHQDLEIPIPGFMILVSNRHIQSIDEFTDDESNELMGLLVKVRKGMRHALGVQAVTIIQEENSSDHFHIWLFPWYDWMKNFGYRLQAVREIMEYARSNHKTPEKIEEVNRSIVQLKDYFLSVK